MDIRSFVWVLALFSLVGAYFAIRSAIKTMQAARKLSFYSLRKQQNAGAWRLFFLFIFLIVFAFWLPNYGEPLIYVYYPPSLTPSMTPTITTTPTISLTPTITLTPTLTNTPSVTDTPSPTPTPFLPAAIEALFTGPVTPNPDAVFGAIQFSTNFDGLNAIDPQTSFQLPIKIMYGVFAYNNTIPGVQWSALWWRDDGVNPRKLVCYETQPWNGGTGGGGGYTDCETPTDGWQAGEYEVQIFMGYEWKVIGRFRVMGELATNTPGATATITETLTITPTP